MTNLSDVAAVARALTDAGFFVVPLVHGSKAAYIKDWPSLRIRAAEVDRFFGPERDPGIGLLLGVSAKSDRCPAGIDVDVDDPILIERVALAIGAECPRKRGQKGLTFLVCTAAPFKARHLMTKDVIGQRITAIDVLSRGEQTVIPPSIHPTTGEPYQWLGSTLLDFTLESLPLVDEYVLSEIELAVKKPESVLFSLNVMLGSSDGSPGDVHNSVLSAVASMVGMGWPDDVVWRRVERATDRLSSLTGYDPPRGWEQQVRGMIEDARAKGFDKRPGKGDPHVDAADWMLTQWRGPGSVFNLDGTVAAYERGHFEICTPYAVRHAVAEACPVKLDGHHHWETVHRTMLDRSPIMLPSDRSRVCLQNGTVDLDTGQLRAWSPEDRLLTYLPFDYDPAAECPTYDAFMRDTFRGPDCEQAIYTFEEFAAHTLVPCLKYQKFLVLKGAPATGKSMLLHLMAMLHGPSTVTAVSTSKFGDEKYSAHMVGKLVNLTSEVAAMSYASDEFLRAVTVGDQIVVRHLYQPPMRVVLPTRIVVACNEMFRIRDTSGAIERRMMILPCDNVVPPDRQDVDMRDRLRAELPGIFLRMMSAWLRLAARGRFDWSTEAQRQALDAFAVENNHVLQWYRERTHQGMASVDPTHSPARLTDTENSLLFSDYSEWAKFNAFQPISSITFGMRLSGISADLSARIIKVGGNSVRVRPLTLLSEARF